MRHGHLTASIVGAYGCEWTPRMLREIVAGVRAQWINESDPRCRVAVTMASYKAGYGPCTVRLRRIEAADYESVEALELLRLLPNCINPMTECEVYCLLQNDKRHIACGIVQDAIGDAGGRILDDLRTILQITKATYGYLFRQIMRIGPVLYECGLVLHSGREELHEESRMNVSWWGHTVTFGGNPCPPGLLRGIYLENYLSQPYLDARIGKTATTLKEWLEADPVNRGTLEPYTDRLTKWTPPVEKIPQIREELYRAGRVYYWRFFCPGHAMLDGSTKPEPLYRPDLSAPWEAPDPIPEIYRADYWKDKDPGLTY